MVKKFLFIFFYFFSSVASYALIEVNGDYGLSQQTYGNDRSNTIESTTVGASIALYLFRLTAVEFNFNQTETITEENRTLAIDNSYNLTRQVNTVQIYSYGIGIKQAFAHRKARIRPSMSIGYARQFTNDSSIAYFENVDTGNTFSINSVGTKSRYDSVFGSFALEIMLTRAFSIRGSVKTIFEAFKFDKAQDNMNYLLGFSWYL